MKQRTLLQMQQPGSLHSRALQTLPPQWLTSSSSNKQQQALEAVSRAAAQAKQQQTEAGVRLQAVLPLLVPLVR
jgi:hypothetical protein